MITVRMHIENTVIGIVAAILIVVICFGIGMLLG